MRLLVRCIRHGESISNAGLPTDDHMTIPLSDRGWQQAEEIAASISTPPDLILIADGVECRDGWFNLLSNYGVKMLIRKIILSLFLVVMAGSGLAGEREWKTLFGRVVGVVDGDTIDVLTVEKSLHRIRLMGIDSPEKRQPFYNTAKDALALISFNKQVEVRFHSLDNRQKRIVGQVFLPDGSDANLAMVESGMAWWFRDYSREQMPEDRVRYERAERTARQRAFGLWADSFPLEPWKFRKQIKEAAAEKRRAAESPSRY